MSTEPPSHVSPGEQAVLQDAKTDDVSLVWVLIHLGLRENPPSNPDWRPGAYELDAMFDALARLQSRGLIAVGRIEYVE